MKDQHTILGIDNVEEITEDVIKKAYRAKLKTVHPEDDPEGFKKLRQAYEVALSELKNKANEAEYIIEDPEIASWIEKIDKIYNYFPKRISVDEWKILLKDEVCTDLDRCDVTREVLLVYIMTHFRLPGYIWKQIDDTFNIVYDQEALFEIFNSNFLKYVIKAIKSEQGWDYSLFEGEPTANYDAYIGALIKLNHEECMKESIDLIENSGIIHPTGEIDKMIYYTNIDDIEKATQVEQFLRDRFSHILNVQYNLAMISLYKENFDQFIIDCDTVLNKEPNHYGMNVALARFNVIKERYKEAYDILNKLKEMSSNWNPDKEFTETYDEAVKGLIPQVIEALDKNTEDDNIKMHLAKLYNKINEFEKGIKIAETINIENVNLIEYYKLLSGLYYINLEKSKEYTLKYIEACEEINQLDKIDLFYERLVAIILNLADKTEDKSSLEVALKYINKAIEIDKENLKYVFISLKIYKEMEDYEKCLALCDYLDRELEEDHDRLDLYKMRIDICEKLKSINLILESYMKLVKHYPEDPHGHIVTLNMCIVANDQELTENVLSWINAYKIESLELEFLKMKIMLLPDNIEHDKVEHVIDVLSTIIALAEDNETEHNDLKDINQVYFTIAQAYTFLEEADKGLENIKKCIEHLTNEEDIYVANQLMANSLQQIGDYISAIPFYENCLRIIPDSIYTLSKLMNCYVNLDESAKLLEIAERIIEIDSENISAIFLLQVLYRNKFKETTNQKDYLKAVKYGKKFVEIDNSAYANFRLGIIYELGNDPINVVIHLEKAMQFREGLVAADYTELIIKLAIAYKLLKNYNKAIEYALKIIWIPDKTNHPKAYSILSFCYQQKNEYKSAIHY
ncbi:MAG: hypothetical protein ATN32_06435, partial [Candidatus Epulonipiscium fishelsonii]